VRAAVKYRHAASWDPHLHVCGTAPWIGIVCAWGVLGELRNGEKKWITVDCAA
jgi:hypothetical protein